MIQTALLQDAHSDLITDTAYDNYGLSLATCGLDQRIKIWACNEESGQWSLEDDWKAHDASITKVAWAHPAFGPIIASASFDRTVKIWEQVQGGSGPTESQTNGAAGHGASRWVERSVFLEARGSVRSIEFAPHHFGLKLATISTDNYLRIYECLEQPALSTWQLMDEIDVSSLPNRDPVSSSQTAFEAAGSASAVNTPTPGTHIAGVDGASVANLLQQQVASSSQRTTGGIREADGGWSLSWCKERYWGEVLAVAAGADNTVKLVQFTSHRRPQTILSLSPTSSGTSSFPGGSGGGGTSTTLARAPSQASGSRAYAAAVTGETGPIFSVTSVAWAPSCGRSYHLIAAGSRDGNVRVWKVRAPPPSSATPAAGKQFGFDMGMGATGAAAADISGDAGDGVDQSDEKWSATLVAEFDDHKSSVGRVEWNVTGTILSSSGNDGRVRLWKQTVGGTWRPAGQISVEQEDQNQKQSGGDISMDDEGAAD